MIAVHEESPTSQKHFTDLKALYEWENGNLALLPSAKCRLCSTDTRIVGVASLCLVHNITESMVLLDLSSARCKQREDPVTAKELAALRGLLGQLMWLATQVIPQLQAPLSLFLGYLSVATVWTLLDANKLARRALVWAQTPLRTFVHEEMSVIG